MIPSGSGGRVGKVGGGGVMTGGGVGIGTGSMPQFVDWTTESSTLAKL